MTDPAADAGDQVGTGTEGVEDPLGPPGADSHEAEPPADHQAGTGGALGIDPASTTVEELITILEATTAERNEYLDALRRNQADFENYRKRSAKQMNDDVARGVASLVDTLLPVLDACDAAAQHGATEVEPIYAALLGALEKEGLERIHPGGEEFDPTRHEAVMHEPAADGDATTVVSDVMRAGFAWKGRVLRPAMVKVRG